MKLIKKSDRDDLFYPRLDLSLTEGDPPHINSIRMTAIKMSNTRNMKRNVAFSAGATRHFLSMEHKYCLTLENMGAYRTTPFDACHRRFAALAGLVCLVKTYRVVIDRNRKDFIFVEE